MGAACAMAATHHSSEWDADALHCQRVVGKAWHELPQRHQGQGCEEMRPVHGAIGDAVWVGEWAALGEKLMNRAAPAAPPHA